jgi:hypothetical protein
MTFTQTMLEGTAIALVIPLAIVLGTFWRNGAVAIMGAVALAAFGANWAVGLDIQLTGGYNSPSLTDVALNYGMGYVFAGGALLLFGGWAIALTSAARNRRWGAVVWLVGGVFATVVIFTYGLAGPDNGCLFGDAPCLPAKPVVDSLWFLLSSVIGPATLLAYALLRPSSRASARAA